MAFVKQLLACALVAHLASCHPINTNPQALKLHSTAYRDDLVTDVGGATYNKESDEWHGVYEGEGEHLPAMHAYRTNWAPHSDLESDPEEYGTIDWLGTHEVVVGDDPNDPKQSLKLEGIVEVPTCPAEPTLFTGNEGEAEPEFYVVSESYSDTKLTKGYFSKRHGVPDLNTFHPGSQTRSRLLRVSSTGEVLEEVDTPEWLLWDGVYDWDPTKCYGTRVFKGFHDLALLKTASATVQGAEVSTADIREGDAMEAPARAYVINQVALYQDGPEPTVFAGSHVRFLVYDIASSATDESSKGCETKATYSHSHRYETARIQMDVFQKGARHVRAVMGMLAISSTEFIVTETELFEAAGTSRAWSDVFYVKLSSEGDTVDHCDSLMECDVPIPEKRHLLRRELPYEISDVSWGPSREVNGEVMPTIAVTYENDEFGILMELYTFDKTLLELEPIWENNIDSDSFVRQRTTVLTIACVVFVLAVVGQYLFIRRQQRRDMVRSSRDLRGSFRRRQSGSEVTGFSMRVLVENNTSSEERGWEYRDYVLISSVVNSCLLGGVVFGFPGLVLILRREGIYADVCSCGVFCAGQQEKISMLSTMGFAAAIGSRLFAGIFLDKFGPKLTGVLSGIISTVGCLLLATAADSAELTDRVIAAWIILAVGGSSMHLTSFHVTNLQSNAAEKRKASTLVSAGFGAGSLVLPVLQVLNQFADVSLQVLMGIYAGIAVLLTINCFFVQPWRAYNSIGTEAERDFNFLRSSWWPSNLRELTAVKKKLDPKFPPLREALGSFQFWGECTWFTCQLFLLTYYLSTINQILFALGDASINQDVDNLQNNMFTRACVFFNGFGWLWSPIVAYTMKTKTIYFRIFMEIGMATVMALMLTVPIIEVQVVVFLLQALVRLQVFSNHFAYIAERFGFRHFGLLNGISSLVAGSFGLLGYLLQMYSLFIAKGNFGISYFFVAALVLSSCFFPIILRRKDRAEAEEKERIKAEQELLNRARCVDGDDKPSKSSKSIRWKDEDVDEEDDEEAPSDYEEFVNILYESVARIAPGYEAFVSWLYSTHQDDLRAENSDSADMVQGAPDDDSFVRKGTEETSATESDDEQSDDEESNNEHLGRYIGRVEESRGTESSNGEGYIGNVDGCAAEHSTYGTSTIDEQSNHEHLANFDEPSGREMV